VHDAIRKCADGHFFVLASAMMIDMERLGGLRFDTGKGIIEDIPLYIRMLLRGPYGIAGKRILATYRMHTSNISRSASLLYRGMHRLRAMQAADSYGAETVGERDAVDAIISNNARRMLLAQLAMGQRRRAIAGYAAEFRHQLRQGRLKFLSLYPLLLLAPSDLINWIPLFSSIP
jgi:hypothetical protein